MCLQGEEMKKETKIDVKNIEEEFQFPMSLMAISSLLKSKGITPDITSIASRLAVDGKPRIIDNPFLCTVFKIQRRATCYATDNTTPVSQT
jgi:hypothetical protein